MGKLLPEQVVSIDRLKIHREPHPLIIPREGEEGVELEDDEFAEYLEVPPEQPQLVDEEMHIPPPLPPDEPPAEAAIAADDRAGRADEPPIPAVPARPLAPRDAGAGARGEPRAPPEEAPFDDQGPEDLLIDLPLPDQAADDEEFAEQEMPAEAAGGGGAAAAAPPPAAAVPAAEPMILRDRDQIQRPIRYQALRREEEAEQLRLQRDEQALQDLIRREAARNRIPGGAGGLQRTPPRQPAPLPPIMPGPAWALEEPEEFPPRPRGRGRGRGGTNQRQQRP